MAELVVCKVVGEGNEIAVRLPARFVVIVAELALEKRKARGHDMRHDVGAVYRVVISQEAVQFGAEPDDEPEGLGLRIDSKLTGLEAAVLLHRQQVDDGRFELDDASEGKPRALVQRDCLSVPNPMEAVSAGIKRELERFHAEDHRREQRGFA